VTSVTQDFRLLKQVVQDFLLAQTAISATLAGLALGAWLLAVVGIYGSSGSTV